MKDFADEFAVVVTLFSTDTIAIIFLENLTFDYFILYIDFVKIFITVQL